MNTQFDELFTDDDLEQVNGGCTNEAGAEAAGWAAVVWTQCGCPGMAVFFHGMATAWGG